MTRQLSADLALAVGAFLDALDEAQRAAVQLPFDGAERQRWTYLPGERAGLPLGKLDLATRALALRPLGVVLSAHAFAQALTIMALDDVLAHAQPGRPDRGATHYAVAVYGEPRADAWGWRLEGHHLSVNVTSVEGLASATPLFLGANPACTRHGEFDVVRPLPREEELGRALLAALPRAQRDRAVVAAEPPADIETADSSHVRALAAPAGVAVRDLTGGPATLADALVATYRDRLAPELAPAAPGNLHLAWAGGLEPGEPHYYRLQGERFLVEYDNTQDAANHIHTVLRDPADDFGRHLLVRRSARER